MGDPEKEALQPLETNEKKSEILLRKLDYIIANLKRFRKDLEKVQMEAEVVYREVRGEKGEKGDRGIQGEVGPRGPKGDRGEPGEDYTK